MPYKKLFFIFLILIQISVIIYLSQKIYQQKRNVLGKTTTNPIKKESIVIEPSKELKYFYEPKPNIKYQWLNTEYFINSDGLHETKEYSIERPEDAFRIITLGDSFTFGLLVGDDENWPAILENKLISKYPKSCKKKIEVINLGEEGYDFAYVIERFNQRGKKYHPDLLLWLNVDFLRNRELMKEVEKDIGNPLLTPPPFEGDRYYQWRMIYNRYLNKYPQESIIQYQTSILEQFIEKNKTIPLVFLDVQEKYRFVFEKLANKKNVFFKPIKYTSSMKIEGDGHPNKFGHQKIAQEVEEFLIKNKLIPCQQ